MNRDELLRKIDDAVTSEMIYAGEGAFDYPSDYLSQPFLKRTFRLSLLPWRWLTMKINVAKTDHYRETREYLS